MDEILGVAYLFLPLFGGAVFHGFCIKFGWLSSFTSPIDGGRTWRDRPIFGANKTFRGLVAVALGAALVLGLQEDVLHQISAVRQVELFDYSVVNGWLLGLAVGASAMLAELPNSFLKRRLCIPSGQQATGILRLLFFFLDQVDVLLGAWLIFATVMQVTAARIGISVVIVFVMHNLVTVAGYGLGMRKTAR